MEMEQINEEPTRKRQRRNAIRPNSEETRAIRTVADEFQMRTAIEIMNSLSVNEIENNENIPIIPTDVHSILSQISICNRLFDFVPTTAIYADSEIVLPSSAVSFPDEMNRSREEGKEDQSRNNEYRMCGNNNVNDNEIISLPIALPIVAALKPEDVDHDEDEDDNS